MRTCNAQAVWVFTVSLPVIFVNAPASENQEDLFTIMDIIGLVIFILALLLETIADVQKYRFKAKAENKGKWCDVGTYMFRVNQYFKFTQ